MTMVNIGTLFQSNILLYTDFLVTLSAVYIITPVGGDKWLFVY